MQIFRYTPKAIVKGILVWKLRVQNELFSKSVGAAAPTAPTLSRSLIPALLFQPSCLSILGLILTVKISKIGYLNLERSRLVNNSTLHFRINVGPMLIYFWQFSHAYALIQVPTFINLCYRIFLINILWWKFSMYHILVNQFFKLLPKMFIYLGS